jgi:hypothetical protein
MKVYLSATVEGNLTEKLPEGAKSIALWRRMTPLQKAVMLCLIKMQEQSPEILARFREAEAPIYLSSAYGEISPMLRVTENIEANSLPVSPKDFQHSVLNASIAYYCMQIASHQAGYAISGSYESADLALQLAARRIDAGLDASAVVIHAEETLLAGGEAARAEILFLDSKRPTQALAQLRCLDQSHDDFTIGQEPGDYDFDESIERKTAWLLNQGKPSSKRRLRNRDGHILTTEWEIY